MTIFSATLAELFFPFFLTFGVTSFILVMQRVYTLITLMVEKLFSLSDVGLMLFYLLPDVFTIAIPLGVVGAVFITVIRQSVDSEIICLRAAGKSLWSYSLPVLLFGLLWTVATAGLSVWLQPLGYQKFTELQAKIIKANADEKLRPGRFNYQFGQKVIQIGARSADNELSDIFIADRVQTGSSSIILADAGHIAVDDATKQVLFKLRNGAVYSPGSTPGVLRTVNFERLSYRLSFQPQGSSKTRRLKRTTTEALWREAQAFKPDSLAYHRWMLEFYSRLTLPLACLVFALTAIPMAIVEPRSGRSGSFLRAVFLVVTFYIIWIGFKNLVKSGKAPPEILWLPLMLVLVYGLFRLWQVNADVSILSLLARKAKGT